MTIIKQKNQRVGVFIDAQNLYHSARNLYGANVNFKNILEDVTADRFLIRAIAYVITTESGEEGVFFEALKKVGIETKEKDLQIFIGGAKKADWDVGIAIDAIRLAPKLDAVIIVSGDGDFVPLVEYLKFSAGCQVEVASFRKSSSAKLVEACDDFLDLSENKDRYLINKKNFRQNKNIKTKKISEKKESEKTNNSNKKTVDLKKERRGMEKIPKVKKVLKKIINKKNFAEISRVSTKDIIIDGTLDLRKK
ncbi:MAG: NYN domain-containing protein [Candidatus Pacebacteria bacterium]|nr:NYN domain-containing protein [Candidatus Paceibacterota bacterium]